MSLAEGIDNGGIYEYVGTENIREISKPFNFALNLKLLYKTKFILKTCKDKFYSNLIQMIISNYSQVS